MTGPNRLRNIWVVLFAGLLAATAISGILWAQGAFETAAPVQAVEIRRDGEIVGEAGTVREALAWVTSVTDLEVSAPASVPSGFELSYVEAAAGPEELASPVRAVMLVYTDEGRHQEFQIHAMSVGLPDQVLRGGLATRAHSGRTVYLEPQGDRGFVYWADVDGYAVAVLVRQGVVSEDDVLAMLASMALRMK